jgi:hypothetical protein
MREQILAALARGDEAEAFGVIEPLNGTGWHYVLPLQIAATNPGATKPGTKNQELGPIATTDALIGAARKGRHIRCLKRILRRGS